MIMSKEFFRGQYDPLAALNNAGKLLGMELTPSGHQMVGGYYINGQPHPYRRDKTKVFIWKGRVFVSEEGGQCLSLENWLQQYGGAADYKEAIRMIKGESQALHWNGEMRQRRIGEVRYVPNEVLRGAKAYDLVGCPLFRWMCGMFSEERVREVWDRYNVTTDAHGNCVYWYTDQRGNVLFDKRIAYGEDGHRRKDFFPPRKYRVGDGFSGRCYFGSNTLKDEGKVFVCESEKSALLVALQYSKQAVATGGKGNLRDVDSRMVLLPDMDAREEWEQHGNVWPWWEKWGIPLDEIPEKADIGDMIAYRHGKYD